MLVSWNWLKQYVRLDVSVDELAHRLTMAGLNHESTRDVDGDIAIDFEVTSNRPDCLAHLGIAREAAVVLGGACTIPEVSFETAAPAAAAAVALDVACPDLCPRYTARLVRGVHIGPSPQWMQRRLASCGVSSINNVVDVTNYVLLESGQPLHAFDFDKLQGARIVVRRAKPGEAIVAINQKRFELSADMCVIADSHRAVAVAGVMGGFDTEVGAGTTNLLIESAEFDPLSVRRTSRALGLASESSYRFERGVDPAGVDWASRRCCQLIVQLAGGTVAEGVVSVGQPVQPRAAIILRFSQLRRILGIEIAPHEACDILSRLGLIEIRRDAVSVEVRPPSGRRDLAREIDLIEEVGRIHGYEQVPEDAEVPMTTAPRGDAERLESAARQVLVAAGFFEAVSMSFVDQRLMDSVRLWSDHKPLAVDHSTRRQENLLRQSLLPSLMAARRLNESRGSRECDLFEIARVYLPRPGHALPDEQVHLGLIGARELREFKGVLENLLVPLHAAQRFEARAEERPEFATGRGAALYLGGVPAGYVGQLAESLAAQFDLRSTCCVAELDLGPLAQSARWIPQLQPVPNLPGSLRELSLIVDDAVLWSEVESLVRSAAGPHLESLEFLDHYRGRPIPAGRKSLHFGMTFRAPDRTLTHEEVDRSQDAVITRCCAALRAELRGR